MRSGNSVSCRVVGLGFYCSHHLTRDSAYVKCCGRWSFSAREEFWGSYVDAEPSKLGIMVGEVIIMLGGWV